MIPPVQSPHFGKITGAQMVKINRLLLYMDGKHPDHTLKLIADTHYPVECKKRPLFQQQEYVALRGISSARYIGETTDRLCIDDFMTDEPGGFPLKKKAVMKHFSLVNPQDLDTLATKLNVTI
jgi:hypothetical protein